MYAIPESIRKILVNMLKYLIYLSLFSEKVNEPVVMAWFDDIQAIVTVCAGTDSEKPAAMAACKIRM